MRILILLQFDCWVTQFVSFWRISLQFAGHAGLVRDAGTKLHRRQLFIMTAIVIHSLYKGMGYAACFSV